MRYLALVAVLAAVAAAPGVAMAECAADHAATPVTAQTDSKGGQEGQASTVPAEKVAAAKPAAGQGSDGQVPVAQKATK